MTEENYSVYSKFDIELHKQKFINYMEAVILPSGEIQYAIPSHLEKLLAITGEDREVIYEKMPIWASPIQWLCEYTGCISVWSDFYAGTPTTDEQKKSLKKLIDEGLTK